MIFYHGTSSLNKDSIRRKGLNNPYLTTDIDQALYYAETTCEEKGGEVVILQIEGLDESNMKVDVQALEEPIITNKLKELYKHSGKSVEENIWDAATIKCKKNKLTWKQLHWKDSLHLTNSVMYVGTISPLNIHVMSDASF